MATALAPILESAPMLMLPRIFAPAPTVTLSPKVGWRLPPQGCSSHGHAVVDGHVVADFRRLPYDDAHPVIDEKSSADARPRVNLHACEEAG
jgi:hypothetical protein